MCEGISEKAPIINQTFLSSSGSSSHTIIHIHHNWLFRALYAYLAHQLVLRRAAQIGPMSS